MGGHACAQVHAHVHTHIHIHARTQAPRAHCARPPQPKAQAPRLRTPSCEALPFEVTPSSRRDSFGVTRIDGWDGSLRNCRVCLLWR